jgi:hypothetical protein
MGGLRYETLGWSGRRNNSATTAFVVQWPAFLAPQPGRAQDCPALEPFPEAARGFFCPLARLRQPQDHVGVALAWAAHGPQAVDISRIEPNEVIAVGRAILLNANT